MDYLLQYLHYHLMRCEAFLFGHDCHYQKHEYKLQIVLQHYSQYHYPEVLQEMP